MMTELKVNLPPASMPFTIVSDTARSTFFSGSLTASVMVFSRCVIDIENALGACLVIVERARGVMVLGSLYRKPDMLTVSSGFAR